MTALASAPLRTTSQDEGSAWRRYADELARWAMARLVNRTDVWGGYLPLCFRTRGGSKSVTKPRVDLRGQRRLTHDVLVAHFRGRDPGHVVGTHSTSPANTSLWAMVDLDAHDGGNVLAVANERAAKAWYWKLTSFGFRPLLTTSDEHGGFHLRVLFDGPVPTPRAYALARWLTADHAEHYVDQPEVFPKQARVDPDGFGNWVRVPGPHHTRPLWSMVWDGATWLAGDSAVRFILDLAGDDPDLIPPTVVAPPPRRPAGLVVTNLPDEPPRPSGSGAPQRMTDAEVALTCLAAIDNAGDGVHYDRWLAAGMVLHDVDRSLFGEWVAWSRRSTKHVDGVCEAKWASFGGRGGYTLGTLVQWARASGTDVYARGSRAAGGGRR